LMDLFGLASCAYCAPAYLQIFFNCCIFYICHTNGELSFPVGLYIMCVFNCCYINWITLVLSKFIVPCPSMQ
jgi:hypothetical protein